jgi:hypothetical protein
MFTWADVRAELAVLREAPAAFVLLVALTGFVIYRMMNRLAEHRLATKDDQIAALNERIEGFKDRLNFSVGTQDVKILPQSPPPSGWASPDQLLTPAIRGVSFRLVDALGKEPGAELRGRVFEDCHVYGPAVLLFGRDIKFEGNILLGPFEAIAWEIDPSTRPHVAGVIRIENAVFRRCRFEGVGFAGNSHEISLLRRSMEMGPIPAHLLGPLTPPQ